MALDLPRRAEVVAERQTRQFMPGRGAGARPCSALGGWPTLIAPGPGNEPTQLVLPADLAAVAAAAAGADRSTGGLGRGDVLEGRLRRRAQPDLDRPAARAIPPTRPSGVDHRLERRLQLRVRLAQPLAAAALTPRPLLLRGNCRARSESYGVGRDRPVAAPPASVRHAQATGVDTRPGAVVGGRSDVQQRRDSGRR